jgi:hypothetical protein
VHKISRSKFQEFSGGESRASMKTGLCRAQCIINNKNAVLQKKVMNKICLYKIRNISLQPLYDYENKTTENERPFDISCK